MSAVQSIGKSRGTNFFSFFKVADINKFVLNTDG